MTRNPEATRRIVRVVALLGGIWAMGGGAAGAAPPPLKLQLPMLDGSRFVQLSDFADRVVVLNFWGSECPPCVRELPLLAALSRQHPNVQFLGIATDPRELAKRFVSQFHPDYPQLIAINRPEILMRRLGNSSGGLPYTVVLDANHGLCASHLGEVDQAWLASALSGCADAREDASSRASETP